MIFFLFAWPLLLYLIGFACPTVHQAELQVNTILCMAAEATYEYNVVFRLGPATDGRNLPILSNYSLIEIII